MDAQKIKYQGAKNFTLVAHTGDGKNYLFHLAWLKFFAKNAFKSIR